MGALGSCWQFLLGLVPSLRHQEFQISDPLPQAFLYTDASSRDLGWGHVEALNASGLWSKEELVAHQMAELEAVFHSMQTSLFALLAKLSVQQQGRNLILPV